MDVANPASTPSWLSILGLPMITHPLGSDFNLSGLTAESLGPHTDREEGKWKENLGPFRKVENSFASASVPERGNGRARSAGSNWSSPLAAKHFSLASPWGLASPALVPGYGISSLVLGMGHAKEVGNPATGKGHVRGQGSVILSSEVRVDLGDRRPARYRCGDSLAGAKEKRAGLSSLRTR